MPFVVIEIVSLLTVYLAVNLIFCAIYAIICPFLYCSSGNDERRDKGVEEEYLIDDEADGKKDALILKTTWNAMDDGP